MKLNYLLRGNGPTILLIHGLFGSLDNLGVLAKDLLTDHQVLQIDLRNHGLSPHTNSMAYQAMAQDIKQLIESLQIDKISIVGHSMGGKVAMTLTTVMPELIDKLIVLDIAPVIYHERRHDEIFAALNAVTAANVATRMEASAIMRHYIKEESVILFLLKSFKSGKWFFNVDALYQQYDVISGWQPIPAWSKPTLFIKGQRSPYISRDYWQDIATQFPTAKAHVIAGAGHWVHGEKPDATIRVIRHFLAETNK